MDEFVEQFLIEARELIEQASGSLDALDRNRRDAPAIDGLFRAIHTLKGAAGIVDFDAMGRALHAVEEVLSKLRTSPDAMPATLVADGYACIDQVTCWLDAMQTTGAPPTDAEAAADALIRRFDYAAPIADARQSQSWLERLRRDHAAEVADSACAFFYRPAEDAFFRGEDPLARAAMVPELSLLDLSLPDDADLESLDPFACMMQIAALTRAPASEVRRVFADVPGEMEIVTLAQSDAAIGPLSAAARAVLEAQILMLEQEAPDGLDGRVGSAGAVALNILQLSNLTDAAEAVAVARGAGRDALIRAIRTALDGPVVAEPSIQAPATVIRSLRVDIDRIDTLVNLTGELIVVKNAIGHLAGLAQAGSHAVWPDLRKQHDLFERLLQQLQRAVLDVRVMPLRRVFQRFPRLIREISATLAKPVTLVMEGETTEADATVVESLFEPLLHVLRNAIGHGVEDAPGRVAAAKPAISTIVLRARRQLEHVIVEVVDDGRGIDVARVRQTALARQVVTPEQLAGMGDDEIVALIFAPGFSTAAEVTDLSGRGVGMDAVKTAVERIGGTVAAETRAGAGTTIRLILPFSVMMTRVMTVEVAGQMFGLPLDAVIETASVPRSAISPIGGGRAMVLRGRTLPVLDLSLELNLPATRTDTDEAKMVVIAHGDQLGAIEVDRLGDRMEIMLKPMEGLLQGMASIAGSTLLGDGRVLLVLDVQELFI